MDYSRILAAQVEYSTAVERDPLERFRGTPPQLSLWQCPSKRRLLRTGNQVGGKTTAAIVEALWWATHRHPHRSTPRGPVQIWFICVSWTQSLAIQKKIWALLPKDSTAPGCRYDPETGFGTKAPVITFLDGSQIWIKTGKQDPLDHAGGTVHLVVYDEPPKRQRNFAELERRLTRTGGEMILVMTPINARIDWIRDMAERAALTDLHFRCTPEMMTLEDGTVLRTESGESMDAAWIEGERTKIMPHEVPVLLDGEWETMATESIFAGWRPSEMWIPRLMESAVGPKGRDVHLLFGIDYGDDRLRTAAVLVAVAPRKTRSGSDTVWVLGEYVPERSTTTAMDAAGILTMLAGAGVEWKQLSGAHGDKRYTDASGRLTKKSNAFLEAALSRRLGLRGAHTVPPVRSAKRGQGRGAGAVWHSVRWLHDIMLTPNAFYVDASCVNVRKAFETWDGTERHPSKDTLDGLRYALTPYWSGNRRSAAPVANRLQIR
jgi:hypothetical protein